jgi:hypothetical protein
MADEMAPMEEETEASAHMAEVINPPPLALQPPPVQRKRGFSTLVSESDQTLKGFSKAYKQAAGGPWHSHEVPASVRSTWEEKPARIGEENNDADWDMYLKLDALLRWAKQHVRYLALYGVVIARCLECAECKHRTDGGEPWRGPDYFAERTKVSNAHCEGHQDCLDDLCDHRLNEKYQKLIKEMEKLGLTKRRRCGECRQEGHTKKKCPNLKETQAPAGAPPAARRR